MTDTVESKPKVKESGAQVAAAGVIGTVITAALDLASVTEDAFSEQGILGVAAIGIGLLYRFACKWLETRNVTVAPTVEKKLDEVADEISDNAL